MPRMLLPYLPEHHDELLERWYRDTLPEPDQPAAMFTGAWSVRASRLVILWGTMRLSRFALTQDEFHAITMHLNRT